MTGKTLEVLLSADVTSFFILPYYSFVGIFLIRREEYMWYSCFNSDAASVICLPVCIMSFLCWMLEAICSRRYKTTPEVCLTLRLQWLLTAYLTSTCSSWKVKILSSSARPCLLWCMLRLRPPESAVSRRWYHSYDYVLRPLTSCLAIAVGLVVSEQISHEAFRRSVAFLSSMSDY